MDDMKTIVNTNVIKKTFQLFMITAVGLTLIACGQKKDDPPPARRSGDRATPVNGTTIPQSTTYNQTSVWVNLDQGVNLLKQMLYSSISPDAVGEISPTNSTIIVGYIEFDGNGNVIAGNSKMGLEVRDSYYNPNSAEAPAIQIKLSANSGQINKNTGQVVIDFKDEFGLIQIRGTYDNAAGAGMNSMFRGEIYFQNYKATDSQYSNANGRIGSFVVPKCGFFKCI